MAGHVDFVVRILFQALQNMSQNFLIAFTRVVGSPLGIIHEIFINASRGSEILLTGSNSMFAPIVLF
jgi:hypothetical protein